MNIPVLFFFMVLAAAAAAVIIKIYSGNGKESFKFFSIIAVGICLVISILFLPFGDKAPQSLYARAVYALNPDKPEPAKEDEPKEREFPDFVVYECEDYYIGMDKETHVMEIIPSRDWLEKTKNDKERGYYSFSGRYELNGETLNVYAARLSGDRGFVEIVLFEEYYREKTNTDFNEDELDTLFRLYDEDNGYMYGYAFAYDIVENLNYGFRIGDKHTVFDGMYEAMEFDKKYFEYDKQADTINKRSAEKGGVINVLTLMLFVLIVIVLSAALIKVNSPEEGGTYTAVVNAAVGICLTAAIMFLPFGTDSPRTLFGRAVNAFRPAEPATTEAVEKPVTASEPEDELPDFVVYECDDYYIKMSREDHVMQVVPSEERLKDVLATERLVYYDFSDEYELDGHTLNVYAARLAGDPGFVKIVLFEEYHKGKTNPGFTESDALFRLYDEDNGYMYGFAYVTDNVENLYKYGFRIGNKSIYFDGMYEAMKLEKKYFEDDD